MAVLVAIGDDDQSGTVLRVAAELAAALEQQLTAVHLTEETASKRDRELRDEIRAALAETDVDAEVDLEHLNRGGLRTGTAVARQLVDIATGVDIEHIVIGHRSKTRLAELRDGHTGFAVARESPVPVTIVPETVES